MSHSEDVMVNQDKMKRHMREARPFWVRIVEKWATKIVIGSLLIQFPGGYSCHIKGEQQGPDATLVIHSSKFVWQIIIGGKLGLARSYMDNQWDSPDIGAVLDLGLANEPYLSSVLSLPLLTKLMTNFRHRLRANTKKGSKRNIAFHYDLGNSFYNQWLDETMTYSSALFEYPDQLLRDAQIAKYARIVKKLNITKADRVLEIGCGWGGFAEYAARETGCHIVCLTLSQEQAQFAKNRILDAGLSEQVEIRIEDYRNCHGQFDKIVSIEMFEAVGEENWPVYFAKLKAMLREDGQALLQVITIDDKYLHNYRRNADFIQTYIFPGGMLPSQEALIDVANQFGLSLENRLMFGHDYEKTLILWDDVFIKHWQTIEALGFDERFKRMWHYYLHYCAVGFRAGRIDVGQFHFR
ncbi:class I SAM-dependent methyltransferase [Brucellaceae bacterium C25G]